MTRLLAFLLGKGHGKDEIPFPLVRGEFDRILELALHWEVPNVDCVGREMGVNLDRTAATRIVSVAQICTGVTA